MLTTANVKPGIPSASTVCWTACTKSGVRTVGGVALLAVASVALLRARMIGRRDQSLMALIGGQG